jgi:GTPase SAR1 family protein
MQQPSEYDYSLKIFVVGQKNVGKSTLIHQYIGKESKNSKSGSPPKPKQKIIHINHKKVKLEFEEQPSTSEEMSQEWLRGKKISALILLYDPFDQPSFDYICDYHTHLIEFRNKPSFVSIVATKSDLQNKAIVEVDTVLDFASQIDGHFIQASAITGDNVTKVFESVALQYNAHFLSVLELFPVGSEQECLNYIKKTDYLWNHLIDQLSFTANENTDLPYFILTKLQGIAAEINFLQRRLLSYKDSSLLSIRYAGDIEKCGGILKTLKEKLDNLLFSFAGIKFSPLLISKSSPLKMESLALSSIATAASEKTETKLDALAEAKPNRRSSAFQSTIFQRSSAAIPKIISSSALIEPLSGKRVDDVEKLIIISSGHTFSEQALIDWYTQYPNARLAQICPITHKKVKWDSVSNLPLMFENLTFKESLAEHQQLSLPSPAVNASIRSSSE